jgi:hypothetical protein
LKEAVKAGLHGGMLFEELGFRYIGPIDGHNIALLRKYFRMVKDLDGPVLLHVVTEKGHGFQPAARDPVYFHTPAPFRCQADGGLEIKKSSGDIQGYNDDRFRTAYHFGAGALSLLDLKRGVGIYCTRDGRDLPSYERGSPVRTILHWAFYEMGRQLVHGGAVGLPEGGVLLAGKGGSGKSTTALSCLDSDLFYASDDYSLVQPDPEPYVHSIYNTAKVNADNVARLEFLRPAISNLDRLDQQKPLMFLHKHYPQKLIAGFPIRAVLLPRVKGGTATTVTPADPTDALASLALSTIRQLAGADSRATAMIEKVTRRVPCFYLELGTDISLIPGVIRDLITHGAA